MSFCNGCLVITSHPKLIDSTVPFLNRVLPMVPFIRGCTVDGITWRVACGDQNFLVALKLYQLFGLNKNSTWRMNHIFPDFEGKFVLFAPLSSKRWYSVCEALSLVCVLSCRLIWSFFYVFVEERKRHSIDFTVLFLWYVGPYCKSQVIGVNEYCESGNAKDLILHFASQIWLIPQTVLSVDLVSHLMLWSDWQDEKGI